jgi:hypothetical protein
MRLKTWAQLSELKVGPNDRHILTALTSRVYFCQGLSMTVNVLAAAADVLIAASLCYFLQCSRTGFKKYDLAFLKQINV